MNQQPVHRRRNRQPPPPAIPTLGATLRLIRDSLGLTRVTAYERHGVSNTHSYVVEADKLTPKLETLEAMISGYKVSPLMARHLRELRSPPANLAPLELLRERVTSNRDWMNHLVDLQDRGVLAAYLDPLWNVLACNTLFQSAMPGLEETFSITAWLFSPIAREIWVDWDKEAAWKVGYDKAMLGLYRDSQQSRDLIKRLSPNREFRRIWAANTDVNYHRSSDSMLRLRQPRRSEVIPHWFSVAPQVEDMTILLATAIPKPQLCLPRARIQPFPDHSAH